MVARRPASSSKARFKGYQPRAAIAFLFDIGLANDLDHAWLTMVMMSHACELKRMAEVHEGMESQIATVTEDMETVDKHNCEINT